MWCPMGQWRLSEQNRRLLCISTMHPINMKVTFLLRAFTFISVYLQLFYFNVASTEVISRGTCCVPKVRFLFITLVS